LNGSARIAFSWVSLAAFVRISTHPKASANPLKPSEAWKHVEEWLDCEPAWIPNPTEDHRKVLGDLVTKYQLRGNLITDAQLAALAIEHGLAIYSTDTDFARFDEITWNDPLKIS
jgi:toxin-antitoxin system PIN domain toxin